MKNHKSLKCIHFITKKSYDSVHKSQSEILNKIKGIIDDAKIRKENKSITMFNVADKVEYLKNSEGEELIFTNIDPEFERTLKSKFTDIVIQLCDETDNPEKLVLYC